MSLRAVRVFDRKVQEHEAPLVADLVAALGPIRVPARPQITAQLQETLDEVRWYVQTAGDLFLSRVHDEAYVLADRDLRTLVGQGFVPEGEAEYNPASFARAWDLWEVWCDGAFSRVRDEVLRQGFLAWQYDESPREGWALRVGSPDRVRRMGRRGMGVLPSLRGPAHVRLTDTAYALANETRVRVVESV